MKKKVLVTGGSGLVGTAVQQISKQYREKYDFIFPTSKQYDLRYKDTVDFMFKDLKPNYVIHLAAKVGGVGYNNKNNTLMYLANNHINENVLSYAFLHKVEKIVSLLSSCVYPAKTRYPLKEEYLHKGEPHSTNFGYAYAKRMVEVFSRSLSQETDLQTTCLIPNNLYGFNDNFNIKDGHVIPALIHKIYNAKMRGDKTVEIWGSGKPKREFTFANDLAKILIESLEKDIDLMNVGNTQEISIKQLAEMIKKEVGFQGQLLYNKEKLEGQFRKPMSVEKFNNEFKDFKFTSLEDGLKQTINWFKENYETIRK